MMLVSVSIGRGQWCPAVDRAIERRDHADKGAAGIYQGMADELNVILDGSGITLTGEEVFRSYVECRDDPLRYVRIRPFRLPDTDAIMLKMVHGDNFTIDLTPA